MGHDARFLAMIPARGGSTGLPGKNRRRLRGISLVARAVRIARRVEAIRWILVSTDDEVIAREAEEAGASVPFFRPPELSGGEVPMVRVLRHALGWFREHVNEPCDGLVLLQPTSPMRRSAHVREAISRFRKAREDDPQTAAVHTVSPVPRAFRPGRMRRLDRDSNGLLRVGGASFPHDEETDLYYRNGAAIVLDPERIDALTLHEGRVVPYVLDRALVSIDSMYDLLLIEHCAGELEPEPWE